MKVKLFIKLYEKTVSMDTTNKLYDWLDRHNLELDIGFPMDTEFDISDELYLEFKLRFL